MKPGPPPKPTVLKLAQGNPGHYPLPQREPKPEVLLPRPPRHLDPIALAFWNSEGAKLLKIRVMTEADAKALELASISYSTFRRAQKVIQDNGFTVERPIRNKAGKKIGSIVVSRPEVLIARQAWRQVMQALAEFGLTPASRTRVQTVGEPKPKDEKAAIQRGALA